MIERGMMTEAMLILSSVVGRSFMSYGGCRMAEQEVLDKKVLDDRGMRSGIMPLNSTPHACIRGEAAHQAGSFSFSPLKPAQLHEQQIALLESRGLVVPDRLSAMAFLAETNYYRLSGY